MMNGIRLTPQAMPQKMAFGNKRDEEARRQAAEVDKLNETNEGFDPKKHRAEGPGGVTTQKWSDWKNSRLKRGIDGLRQLIPGSKKEDEKKEDE